MSTEPDGIHTFAHEPTDEERANMDHINFDCNHIAVREEGTTLIYQGHYGAPGIGMSVRCTMCLGHFSQIGNSIYTAESMAHVMDADDCI